jgi:hypothetical protein
LSLQAVQILFEEQYLQSVSAVEHWVQVEAEK